MLPLCFDRVYCEVRGPKIGGMSRIASNMGDNGAEDKNTQIRLS